MAVLAALEQVDYVVSFDEDTPERLIEALVPDVLVKGGDWQASEVVGRETVESNGGSVVIIDFLKGYSTKGIIHRILTTHSRGDQRAG
jgi:D-beta-D-heptose 7-phosphate kinase/D-beta-D-heptose 1-phosphate adenosyltransferase